MNDTQLTTLEQIRAFPEGTSEVTFTAATDDAARYATLLQVLTRFRYASLNRRDKGMPRHYLGRISGYSRAQLKSGRRAHAQQTTP